MKTILRCSKCRQSKPEGDFSPRQSARGRHSWCKPCLADEMSKARSEGRTKPYDPESRKDYDLRRVYGISLEDYGAMLEAQGGVCRICRKECASGMRLAVDHCHQTGRVRGLLCGKCNTGIGQFSHDLALLKSAIAYLEETCEL